MALNQGILRKTFIASDGTRRICVLHGAQSYPAGRFRDIRTGAAFALSMLRKYTASADRGGNNGGLVYTHRAKSMHYSLTPYHGSVVSGNVLHPKVSVTQAPLFYCVSAVKIQISIGSEWLIIKTM